jgi:hypothetical protein
MPVTSGRAGTIALAFARRRMRVTVLAAVCGTLMSTTSSALAAGNPINAGTPLSSGPPVVAVDSAGNAVIAWANTKDLAGAKNFVQYCVLPNGATGCSQSNDLIPADGAEYVDNVQVLSDGSTLVILADVYGAQGGSAEDYQPEQEWQSTDGGATVSIVNGGKSVAEGNIAGDTNPLNAVLVPGTDVLGYGWNAAVSAPTFHAFPLTSPPECSEATNGCTSGFATLEPDTNPDPIPNLESHFASQLGASPGVLGVFFTNFTNGPLGCSNAQTVPFGTAYAYASGAQSPTNNYNVSPGQPNSAWRVAVSQADCNVEYSTVGGGPSGFGVLEDNELTGQTVYHRFDQNTETFDTPLATVADEGEQSPAVSQDGSGGIYATFLGQGGVGGPIRLAYSGDGGGSWSVNTINPNSDQRAEDVTSNVNAAGQGWVAWTDNGSVYAESFQAADSIPPATLAPAPKPTSLSTTQTSGKTSGASITLTAGTVGETDQATISGANVASAGGTVNYRLYSNPTCTSSSKVLESTAAVTAGKAAASAPVTAALAVGSYYWQAAYSGDANNASSSSTCGSEVLTVIGPATVGESATSTEKSVTLNVDCASFPCTITITLTAPETVVVKAARAAKKHKPKKITLATGTFTLHKAGKVILHLSKGGKKLLAAHHGRLTASLLLSEKINGKTLQSTKTIKIKPAAKAHKKK